MKRFGLIGKTLKHSFSKNYFAKKFAEEGIVDSSYENFELAAIAELPKLVENNPDLSGLNVTIPYKEEVLQFLKFRNEIVEAIGACNCIKIVNGETYGYNTDVIAFKESLQKQLRVFHKSALILGSGGSSKAVQYALEQIGIDYRVVSRSKKENSLAYEDVDEDMMKRHQIIVNTTPLGMFPNVDQAPPIPYHYVSEQHLLYDLTYNPPKTKFLSVGESKGAKIMNGYEMLLAQAEESWRIWNTHNLAPE